MRVVLLTACCCLVGLSLQHNSWALEQIQERREPAWHRKERKRRTEARTLLRNVVSGVQDPFSLEVRSAAQRLEGHHSLSHLPALVRSLQRSLVDGTVNSTGHTATMAGKAWTGSPGGANGVGEQTLPKFFTAEDVGVHGGNWIQTDRTPGQSNKVRHGMDRLDRLGDPHPPDAGKHGRKLRAKVMER